MWCLLQHIRLKKKKKWQIFLTVANYLCFRLALLFLPFSRLCVLLSSSISLSLPSTAQIPVKHTHKVRHQRWWLKPTQWPSRCLFAFVRDHRWLVLQGFWCQHGFRWFNSNSPENMLQTHLRWCKLFLHTDKRTHVHRYACTNMNALHNPHKSGQLHIQYVLPHWNNIWTLMKRIQL